MNYFTLLILLVIILFFFVVLLIVSFNLRLAFTVFQFLLQLLSVK